jgi:MFS superfamily sulfate permease-like transporter
VPGWVVVLLLFLNSLLADLPQTALAAVVITAALSLMNLGALRRYFQVRKSSLVLSLVATTGVVLFGVIEGIGIAIALSILMFFRRSWWPHGEVLGEVDGLEGWHSIAAFPDARQRPGIVVYRWEAPVFFANAAAFRAEIRRLARDQKPSWIVVQCEAITDIDVTAADMLRLLDDELNANGIHVAFAEMRTRLQDLTLRYGLFDTLDQGHSYARCGALRDSSTRQRRSRLTPPRSPDAVRSQDIARPPKRRPSGQPVASSRLVVGMTAASCSNASSRCGPTAGTAPVRR